MCRSSPCEMCGLSRTAHNHTETVLSRGRDKRRHTFGCAMCRHDMDLVLDTKIVQNGGARFHLRHVLFGPHQDRDLHIISRLSRGDVVAILLSPELDEVCRGIRILTRLLQRI